MNRRRFLGMAARACVGLAAGLVSLAGGGCDSAGGTSGTSTDGKVNVAATTSMIGDLVRRIGGDRVHLTVLMGAGVDPHTFKPAPADYETLAAAKVAFYNGLHLEGKMVEVFEDKLKDKSVAITTGLDPNNELLPWQEGENGAHDPHVWFNVKLWAKAVDNICDGLIKADPEGADGYRTRAAEVVASLTALDAEVRQKIGSIPAERRVLITSHDAYGYFGKAYGVDVRGLQGISTETEAGIQAINGAVDYILAKKIPAIFVESSVSPKTIERVRDDCKARGFDVKIGGELFSDAMGQPGQHPGYAVETYEGMVRYNVDTIVNALK